MDIQLKRGLLDVCVLAAIRDGESYGYQIIKEMKPYLEMSESTLYTILKRLEGAGMLTVRTAELVAKVSNKFKYALGGPAMTRRAHLTRKNRKLKHQILHYHEQRNPTTT